MVEIISKSGKRSYFTKWDLAKRTKIKLRATNKAKRSRWRNRRLALAEQVWWDVDRARRITDGQFIKPRAPHWWRSRLDDARERRGALLAFFEDRGRGHGEST